MDVFVNNKVNKINKRIEELFVSPVRINFFDKTKITNGGFYSGSTYQWVANGSLAESEFIPVSSGDIVKIKVTHTGNYQIVYKNASGTIFSGTSKSATDNIITITIPSNAVSFATALYLDEKDVVMITINNDMPSIYTSYDTFEEGLESNVKIYNNNVKSGEFTKDKMGFKTVEDYIVDATVILNLFNKLNITSGGCYDITTFQWLTNASLCQSEFITVTAGDVVKIKVSHTSTNYSVVFKNSDGYIFSGQKKSTTSDVISFTVPNGAVSISLTLFLNEINTFMVVKNIDMPLTYYDYGTVGQSGVTISDSLKQAIINISGNAGSKTLIGKYLSLLGDSISSYNGYIPSGNEYFFPNGWITSVEQTWWKKLIDELGLTLLVNNSWSGSQVSASAGNPTDPEAGCNRAESLDDGVNTPDFIIVWMGINDFNHEVSEGTYNGTTDLPTTTSTFREAYAVTLNKIMTKYTSAKVYVCTLPYSKWNTTTVFPEKNDSGVLLAHWNDIIMELADLFGAEVIRLHQCGMTFQNRGIMTGDGLHPREIGMEKIKNTAKPQLEKYA